MAAKNGDHGVGALFRRTAAAQRESGPIDPPAQDEAIELVTCGAPRRQEATSCHYCGEGRDPGSER